MKINKNIIVLIFLVSIILGIKVLIMKNEEEKQLLYSKTLEEEKLLLDNETLEEIKKLNESIDSLRIKNNLKCHATVKYIN